MIIRNGDYTIFRGYHLLLREIRDDDERYLLSYKGSTNPFVDFGVSMYEKNTFDIIISRDEINSAYAVRTFGYYKGFEMQVFAVSFRPGYVSAMTSNLQAVEQLDLLKVTSNWYGIDINESDLTSIWEERSSTWGLPLPEGLELKKVLK